ncbi:MAG: hypothetical protein JWO12_1508 [Frankiales bacterium]|nr:hypothetical protein [Frankiales bacterium]
MVGRALTKNERALIEFLLRPDFAGVKELRKQVAATSVLGSVDPESVSLNLHVDQEAKASTAADGPVPGRVWAYAADGSALGTLLLWVSDGFLSAVEYGWVTDEPPTSLPPVASLKDLDVDGGEAVHLSGIT